MFVLISSGQTVSVHKVKFTSINNDWLMTEVGITTGKNTQPGAVSERFVENVGIRLYLGFRNDKLDGDIDFYYSDVTAQVLERGDKNTIRFYIPGKEMKMNRYNKPFYYYAEIIINQKAISPHPRAYSFSLNSEGSLKNFVIKAKERGIKNLGRLMPSYLAPISVAQEYEEYGDSPVYLRINH